MPALRTRIKGCVEAIRSGKAASFIPRWDAAWRPQLVARIAELRNVDFRALPDEQLDEHVSRVMALLNEGTVIHFYLHGGLCMALSDLAFTCRDLLGWDDRPTFALLDGLSEKSSEPARRLAELARMAKGRPAVCDLLEHVDEGTMARLADVDGAFAAAFAAYQHEFGFRTLRYEVAELTMAETPALVLELIHDQIVRGYDPAAHAAALERQRAARIAEARAALAARTVAERDRFERALAAAEQAYPVREDSAFYTVGVLLALLRDAVLEVGCRLTERGWIERRDDVFFFELPEARAALRHGGDQRTLVQGRRAERCRVEETPGPATYGSDPGTPPLDALPPEARFATEALLFTIDRILAIDQSERGQGQSAALRGIAAAPGTYTGPARVIQSEAEFARIERGDVLVCPVPSPAWSVLFSHIGALVADTGGILSHAAIIAREYRVPAVVATGHGTRSLHDGQIVTVDGNTGDVWTTSA
jgi:pyruvate,water dikinase